MKSRHDFQNALALRASLSPRDSALLNAFEPAMRMPPDYGSALERFAAVARDYPSDAVVVHAYANALIRLDRMADAIALIDDFPSPPAVLLNLKGLSQALLFDTDAARRTFATCVEVSPAATACIRRLILLASNEGDCERGLSLARQYVAVDPSSPVGHSFLARMLVATGAPRAAADLALTQSWSALSEDERRVRSLEQRAALAVLDGHLDTALQLSDEWRSVLHSDSDEAAQMGVVRFRVNAYHELGRESDADAEAKGFLERRGALLSPGYNSGSLALESLAYRIRAQTPGSSTRDALSRLRDDLMGPSDASLVDMDAIRWWRAYAIGVSTEADAREALSRRPGTRTELTDGLTRTVEQDLAYGRIYRLTGDHATALAHLERGARSCNALGAPFETTWAMFELAILQEAHSERSAACESYGRTLATWGAEPRSTSASAARAARTRLSCPPALP
jgi:serine/threonine-protein kinase